MSSRHKRTPKNPSTEHYTKMLRHSLQTEAWRALSSTAQALYPWVKMEWRGPNANNNGKITLSCRQAAAYMGVRKADTIATAFADLQAKGFVVVRGMAVLGTEGEAKGFQYELTELAMPGVDENGRPNAPRALFKDWRAGSDFPVVRATGNNPKGLNGKTKSHPENRDGPVPKIRTESDFPSRKSGQPIPKMGTK